MKIKFILFMAFQCILPGKVISQKTDTIPKSLGIEAGIDLLYSNLTAFGDNIRGDVPNYYYNSETDTRNLSILFYKKYFGLRTEVYTKNNRFGFSAGLRFTNMHGSVGKNTYWGSTADFFYLLFRQQGNTTEYLKIKTIDQSSNYIGIPLEMRLFWREMWNGQLYFKIGGEFNYKLSTRTDIRFYDDAMKTFHGAVSDMIGQPRSFCSLLYSAVGIKYGKLSKVNADLELSLPTIFLTQETSGLTNPQAGSGIKLVVQIPIKKRAQ
ncbi:MAG TPA: hypothetical protein VIH57_20300 [Bacteroidales bacterium]